MKKFKNLSLKLISKDLIFSNSGEAIVISKDYTKGLLLRGYEKEDFSKLEVDKQNSFIGNPDGLYENYSVDLSSGELCEKVFICLVF